MFKRILLPTDFSETAIRTQSLAASLARRLGATLILAHVDEERALGAHTSADLITFMNEIDARRTEWMESMAAELSADGVKVELERLEGVASEQIIEYAAANNVELIVMGALGHTTIKHMLLGSTSRAVLRGASCPVLTLSGQTSVDAEWDVGRICFPTDFSAASIAGASVVASLATTLGAAVELMHVLRVPIHIPSIPGEPPISLPMSAAAPAEERATADLADFADRLREYGVKEVNTGVSLGGDAAEAIASYAERTECDLIVVPRHGRGGVRSLLFGRVAQNVVKASPLPVLTFAP